MPRGHRAGNGGDPSSGHYYADEAGCAPGDHDLANRLSLYVAADLRILQRRLPQIALRDIRGHGQTGPDLAVDLDGNGDLGRPGDILLVLRPPGGGHTA